MLKSETHLEDFTSDPKQKYSGLLEKKWTSVIRLQKKVHIYMKERETERKASIINKRFFFFS